ncbi:MAG TPA: ATP-binding protein [Hanamia sp.]
MKAAFHYLVKAKVIRKTEGNELDFEEINKKFENENPIIAREEAFGFYQSWIDILLQSKNKEYISDKEARKDLISFIDPGVSTKLYSGNTEIEFNKDSLGNGIGVFFVPDIEIGVSYSGRIEAGAELLIHGIGNFGRKYMLDDNVCILSSEFEYYKHFNYETKSKEIDIVYCFRCWYEDGMDEEKTTRTILETPFNWEGYDKLFWWGRPKEEEVEPVPRPIKEIIQQGENNKVEFKTTLHFKTGKEAIKIKEDIAKTICAFLNSNGGFLFIGINDNGAVQGLDFDFSLANGKNPKDYFRLKFDNMLEQFIGFSIKSNISLQFYEIEGKEIFYVTVSPSKKRLIFLNGQDGKELYVRGEASTRQIKDAEEIINYWKDNIG